MHFKIDQMTNSAQKVIVHRLLEMFGNSQNFYVTKVLSKYESVKIY